MSEIGQVGHVHEEEAADEEEEAEDAEDEELPLVVEKTDESDAFNVADGCDDLASLSGLENDDDYQSVLQNNDIPQSSSTVHLLSMLCCLLIFSSC